MADGRQVAILKQGGDEWNHWRAQNQDIVPDLAHADLRNCLLSGTNLARVNLYEADLQGATLISPNIESADLRKANLSHANFIGASMAGANIAGANLNGTFLTNANLTGSDLSDVRLGGMANFVEADLVRAKLMGSQFTDAYFDSADLTGADLRGTNLAGANLAKAKLIGTNLTGANLTKVNLVEADLSGADLTGCRIYGVSAWGLILDESVQRDLIITNEGEAAITVDNIEVAQFIYLLLNNRKIREVVDTVTSKIVLILGNFSEERKIVLDELRAALRLRNYLPIMFDSQKPRSQTTIETVTLLARMAKFVIADLTDALGVREELQAFVPTLPSVAVQPLILSAQHEPYMFDFIRTFPWVLPCYRYDSQRHLLTKLDERLLGPVEAKVLQIRNRI